MDLLSPRLIGACRHNQPTCFTADPELPATDGYGIVGIRFDFAVEPRSRRSLFVAAFLRVGFDTADVRPDGLWLDHGTAGSVMTLTDGGPGWLFGGPWLATPIAVTNSAYALLEVPTGVDLLAGAIRLDVTSVSHGLTGSRRQHARSAAAIPFTVRLPPDWSAVARPRRTQAPLIQPDDAVTGSPSVRLLVAADIEKFSRFHAPEAARAQRRFVGLLAAARQRAGLVETDVVLQEAGDGQFAVLPAGIDESVVLPELVEGLREALRDTNADLNEHARLRLRVALYRGHVTPGVNGWVGPATTAVHRLLDSDAVRRALIDAPQADLALIIPDVLYREIIVPGYGLLVPSGFVPVEASVPAKDFTESAWLQAF